MEMSTLMRPFAAQAAAEGHLDELTALDWLDGRLPTDQRVQAEAHVDGCAECRHLLAAIARAVDDAAESGPGEPDRAARPTVAVGDRIGPYRVQDVLGVGAMGVVVRAEDPRLGRAVAIKLVRHPDVSEARVRREARTLARLSHPNVVTVLASGVSEAGPWIAMELVEGWTLREWVDQTRPSIEARAGALRAAAAGLRAVHAAGIVHGDFKPGNVLVGADGRVRVADFGLASTRSPRAAASMHGVIAELSPEASTTIAGHGGTPIYMAPETLRGAAPTFASDQFSFCVTAWELLAEARPFEATRVDALLQAIDEGPSQRRPGAAQIPIDWRGVLRRGLAPDPDARFSDMGALTSALGRGLPRTRSSWVLGLGAVLAALVFAAWPGDPCERIADPAARIHDTAAPMLTPADRSRWTVWIDDWATAREGACRSGRERDAACLDARLAHVEGRLDALADGSIDTHEVLGTLEPAADCRANPAGDPPSSPEARRLLRELQVSRGRYGHGASAESRRAFVELARRADALGDPLLRAETYYTLGLHTSRLGHRTAAREAFDVAYFASLEADDADLTVETALNMATVSAYTFNQFDEAERWMEHARAALPRATGPHTRLELEMVHGELLASFGRLDEAEQRLRAAQAAVTEDTSLRLRASLDGTLGNLFVLREDLEQALVHFARAVELHEQRGVRGDRDLPRALNGLAAVYAQLGRFAEAGDTWERMRRLLEGRGLASEVAQLEVNLGALHAMQEDNETAIEHYRAGCQGLIEVLGPTGPETTACHDNLSMTLLEDGRYREAAEAARFAIDAALSGETRMPAKAARPLYTLGHALLELGDASGAVAALRRRIDVRAELDPSTPDLAAELADDRLDLVEVLQRAGETSAAEAELARARAEVEALPEGEDRDELLAEVAELSGG